MQDLLIGNQASMVKDRAIMAYSTTSLCRDGGSWAAYDVNYETQIASACARGSSPGGWTEGPVTEAAKLSLATFA